MKAMENLEELKPSKSSNYDVNYLENKCYSAMDDDFNTPILIAHLFEGVKVINQIKEGKASLTSEDLETLKTTMNDFTFDVLGLMNEAAQNNSGKIDGVVSLLIKLRKEARENRDWALSDQIRDELLVIGIQLKDGRDGTSYTMT